MPTADFSGRDVVKVLRSFGYRPIDRTGSHVRLRYENRDTGNVRLVTVPMHDRIRTGTLRAIATQCGAEDFDRWCQWIDEHR